MFCCEFGLLEKDEVYLNECSLYWEIFVDGGCCWLLLSNFVLLEGYNYLVVDIVIDVLLIYFWFEIDMFYCFFYLMFSNGCVIGEILG